MNDKPQFILIAEKMLGTERLKPNLARMLHAANNRICNSGGDGPVYGRELRSTQVIASIVCTWENLPPRIRDGK